ncbi:MAG: hypothetical protein KDC92_15895, partial [Bacteroidetes bacterium]|nr:hypothetical protein [Bacteroidota bacterium]
MVSSFYRSVSNVTSSFAFLNAVVLLFCLPLVLLGQDVYLGVGDHLDSHVVWYRILSANPELIFADSYTPVSQIMSAPRLSLYNEFYLLFWLHFLFGTFKAMIINQLIMHFVALWGMYYLLKEMDLSKFSIAIGALFFALLPFAQFWGLSIAGQPMVLMALLQINKAGVSFKNAAILAVYVLYSNFYSVSFFFFLMLSLYFFIHFIRARKINWHVVIALISMVILSLIMEYRLIESMFFNSEYTSKRIERNASHHIT